MSYTIHLYRENADYKRLRDMLTDVPQTLIDQLYLTNPHDVEKSYKHLQNLNLNPKQESQILELLYDSWDGTEENL